MGATTSTATNDNPPFNTRVLFSLKDLGIDDKFIRRSRVTMQSEKYICIRETNSVVIIDMAKPTQPIKLPITADSAIMNPDAPILAFKVQAKIGGRTQDQLQIFDITTKTTLKSYNIPVKVECWKWISPKFLGLVTFKAVYHWNIEDMTGPVKVSDMTEELAAHKDAEIINYMHDPSNKWLALLGRWHNPKYHVYHFIRHYQSGRPWFKLNASAAAFTTFNVEGNDTTSTLLCSATGRINDDEKKTRYIELTVSDELDSQQGEPNFRKKHSEFNIADKNSYVIAVQISQKYGLIYVITERGLISIHDLETVEAICSYNITKYKPDIDDIICTTEGPSSESLYAINWVGQVLLTSLSDSSIMSFIGDKLIARGKSRDLQNLYLKILKEKEETVTNREKSLQAERRKKEELSKEIEGLKRQNTELQNESAKIKTEKAEQQIEKGDIIKKLEKSLQDEKTKSTKKKEELATVRTKMLDKIEQLQKENAKLQNEIEKIVTHMAETLQVEQNARRETEEQLKRKMTEIDNYQKLQKEMMNKLEDFRLLMEMNNPEANFTEYSRVELEKVTNNFSDLLKIGEGGYGPVYKAFLGLKPVAIKILKYENSQGNKQFNQEVEILSRVRHPNLVMLLGACQEAHALVYELMPNGDLYAILRNQPKTNALTWKRRIRIASDICSGLICLHSAKPHGIVHGDLKPSNILLDSNYMGKLSDFGICRHLEKTDSKITAHHLTYTIKGTPPYMDPEYFRSGTMTVQCDVYSFGIILLELVTGRDPVGLRDQVEEAFKKGEIFVDASVGEWPLEEAKKMVHLGLRCSDFYRKDRPNLEKEVRPEIESMLRASLRFTN